MRQMIKFSLVVSIVASLFAFSTPVLAKRSASKPNKAAVKQARVSYSKGQKFFNSGQYQEALEAFQKAYDAVPKAIVLLSIAESQKKLGELEGSIASLERYLEERPNAPDRDSVEKKIAEMKSTPAMLLVVSDPAGADVKVDGMDTGKVTPAELELEPGEHAIEIMLNERQKEYKTVLARPGRRHDMQVEFGPLEPEEPPVGGGLLSDSAMEPGFEEEAEQESSIVPWIVIGVGAAAIATGTVLGVLALDEQSSFDEEPTEDSADAGERLALFTDVAFGVGAAAVITGVVLMFTLDRPVPKEEESLIGFKKGSGSKMVYSVQPVFSPRTMGASARVLF